jgi:hypothetical protein
VVWRGGGGDGQEGTSMYRGRVCPVGGGYVGWGGGRAVTS